MSLRKVTYLLLALGAIIYLPYLGALIKFNGSIPDSYFYFPPNKVAKPESNVIVIVITAIIFLSITLLYIFPKLFGFKKQIDNEVKEITGKRFPIWFWIGLILWGGTFVLLVGKFNEPKWILNWALIPLCWGFVFFLDGLVYYISDGNSMLKNRPTELIGLGIMSISGWLIYEYLNFFIEHNWYYPADYLVSTHDKYILYAALGSSGFMPLAFEWYQLLRKSRLLNSKYKHGPRIRVSKRISFLLLAGSVVGLIAVPFNPNNLFYFIWLAPVIIMALILEKLSIWTPFTPIKESGDWTALLVFALTFLAQGVMLECTNYFSARHFSNDQFETFNPAFWKYCIPYVHVGKIFEMPVLGYSGYLLFSIHCWLWWILFANLTGIITEFSSQKDFR